MLVHDLVEVVLRDVVAYFVHGCHYVLGRDMSRTVRVELIENCLQLVIVHEGLHVQRRHQELRVVDLIIAKVVDLCDDLVYLIIGHVEVRLHERRSQLLGVQHARLVLVELVELRTQLLDLLLIGHFDEHVHGCSF